MKKIIILALLASSVLMGSEYSLTGCKEIRVSTTKAIFSCNHGDYLVAFKTASQNEVINFTRISAESFKSLK